LKRIRSGGGGKKSKIYLTVWKPIVKFLSHSIKHHSAAAVVIAVVTRAARGGPVVCTTRYVYEVRRPECGRETELERTADAADEASI